MEIERLSHPPHFMLVPSLACPAACHYCFGPRQGPIMSQATLEQSLDTMARIAQETQNNPIHITFHGGEPLMAGHGWWETALKGLRTRWGSNCRISVQSNLWLLDEAFCRLFKEHRVSLGSSLDGPRAVTDMQRGQGYFERTWQGIRLARQWDLTVGCIATLTSATLKQWRAVVDFFAAEDLSLSLHVAVQPLSHTPAESVVSAAEYGRLLQRMLAYYLPRRQSLQIPTLDRISRGVCCGEGEVCTFRQCLGMFMVIAPNGDIYPCQRFCGLSAYRLGTLAEQASWNKLMQSPLAQKMRARQTRLQSLCSECEHFPYCQGGCPYNAWAQGQEDKDPYCPAYQRIFKTVKNRLRREMLSPENLQAIVEAPNPQAGALELLRRGPLIELARPGEHPRLVARTAKRLVAAVLLAREPDFEQAVSALVRAGVSRTQESAACSLRHLQQQLGPSSRRLNNLYLHITWACPLECSHCYARAGGRRPAEAEMPVDALLQLVRQAQESQFRQVVITGGEPLVHASRPQWLARLSALRKQLAPLKLMLRTNLVMPLTDAELMSMGQAFDQVVVSLDGSQATHDARRGQGAYAATRMNLEHYQKLAHEHPELAKISLAAVLSAEQIQGEPGTAVRTITRTLGLKPPRFRPLLPLGRAQDWPLAPPPEALGAHEDPRELMARGIKPVSTCGLGQNLFIRPSGEAFPCYALHASRWVLGHAIQQGVQAVIQSPEFAQWSQHTVDTHSQCKTCDLRYLCGGLCHAWESEFSRQDTNGCGGLKKRAEALFQTACDYLGLELKTVKATK